MLKRVSKILLAVVLISLSWPVFSSAQNLDISHSLTNELNAEIIPEYPKPFQSVSINLTLYTDDLNSATITWYKDGKQVQSGKGETKYSFQSGPAGEETSIKVYVNLLSGYSFSKTLSITPAGVDLVWEADSYVPPFYAGKALHPYQGTLKIVAVPELVRNGARIQPQNLVYQWSNTVEAYQDQSGYGKNTLILKGSLLGQKEQVMVTVSDPSSQLKATGFLQIAPTSPQIVFYEADPYYGQIFNTALSGQVALKGEEMKIIAAPYYFTKENAGFLQYEWRLNGQSVDELFGSRSAVFRKPEKNKGQSIIALTIENTKNILQQADNRLIMNFEK